LQSPALEEYHGLEVDYLQKLKEQLASLYAGKRSGKDGEMKKRIEMKRLKILEDALLYEDDEKDEEGNKED
jgi:hypothetical protein